MRNREQPERGNKVTADPAYTPPAPWAASTHGQTSQPTDQFSAELPPPDHSRRNRMQLLLGIGLLVAVAVVALVWMFRPGATLLPPPNQAPTAKAAVEGYLHALAAGDAETALGYATAAPADTSLLTKEVLQQTMARSPLANISVNDANGATVARVPASYRLGDTDVTATFEARLVGSDWRLSHVADKVTLTGATGVTVSVNGVEAGTRDSLTLFPGSYRLTSTNPRLMLTGADFMVISPTAPASPSVLVEISPQGQAEARAAVQAKLNQCLKANQLVPSGCGFGVTAKGVKVKSVKWQISSGAAQLRRATFRAEADDPYVSTINPEVQLRVIVTDTAGRTYPGADTIRAVRVDLRQPEIAVTFNG